MSFNLINIQQSNLIDMRTYYKKIAEEFCIKYYSVYDNNYAALKDLYYLDSQFTYQDQEFIGFDTLTNKLRDSGIYKFTHHNMNVTTQPIGPNQMILTILGHISINNSSIKNNFVETISIFRDDYNIMRIGGTIFKIVN
jgi:hypothetical protein